MPITRLFNPASYPHSYQAPVGGGPGDLEAFASLVGRLAATGLFATVTLGGADAWKDLGSEELPAALLDPREWHEAADASSEAVVRHVRYELCLVATSKDLGERYCILTSLSAVAQNALHGHDLGGLVLPALSLIRRGRIELACPVPFGRTILTGSLAYVVSDATARVP